MSLNPAINPVEGFNIFNKIPNFLSDLFTKIGGEVIKLKNTLLFNTKPEDEDNGQCTGDDDDWCDEDN